MSNNEPARPELVVIPDRRPKCGLDTRILASAVLSLALAIALVVFLHLYVRYVRRRSREVGRSASARLFLVGVAATAQDEAPNAGLDPSAIAALPTFPYQSSGDRDKGGVGKSGAECAVCLSAVEEGEPVRLLPRCRHVFHVGCIDMWLGSHSTCPVCRARVEPTPAAAAALQPGQVQASAPPLPLPQPLVAGGEGTSGVKDGGASVPSRLSSSFRRMMSRERSGRRPQGDETEDLERQ